MSYFFISSSWTTPAPGPLTKFFYDTMAMSDGLSKTLPKFFSDTMPMNDSYSRQITFNRTFTDIMKMNDFGLMSPWVKGWAIEELKTANLIHELLLRMANTPETPVYVLTSTAAVETAIIKGIIHGAMIRGI